MTARSRWNRIAALCALWLIACGGEDELEDPAVHACEELSVEAAEVLASATRDESAPEVVLDGGPVRIALPVGAAGYVRVVTEAPEELGIFFFGQTDALTGLWYGDRELGVTSAGANAFCPDEIPEHFDVDFEEPGTYFVQLGPTASNEVWMILSDAGGHGH